MAYQGHALNSSFPRGRKSGSLVIDSSEIAFHYGDKSASLPLDDLDISLGGSGNRLVYFKNPSNTDWVFYCSDQTVIKDKYLAHDRACAECIKKIKSKKLLNVGSVFAFLLCAAFLVVCCYYGLRVAADVAAQNVPPEYEAEAGDKLFKLVTMDKRFVDSAELMAALSKITAPLVKAVENDEHKFKFHIVEDSTLNAFALPGGHVVIHSGLLLKADSAEEVAGVIAHEICHVTQRHHIRGLVNQVGVVLIVQTMFGDASALIATISRFGGDLSTLKNSREFENEADKAAWELLRRANINQKGMISFFEKLKNQRTEFEEGIEKTFDFMSTHPNTAERIVALRARLTDEPQFGKTIDMDFEQLQNELRAVLNKNKKGGSKK